MTRELFSADARVKPADLARGSAFFKNLELREIAVQAPHGSDPRTRKSYKTYRVLPLSCRCSDHMSSQRVEQSPGSTPSYSYHGMQCDANPVQADVVTVVIIRSYLCEIWPMVKRRGQSSSKQQQQHGQQQAPAADPEFSRITAPAGRSTAPVVGLLPEADQLGCLLGMETA